MELRNILYIKMTLRSMKALGGPYIFFIYEIAVFYLNFFLFISTLSYEKMAHMIRRLKITTLEESNL